MATLFYISYMPIDLPEDFDFEDFEIPDFPDFEIPNFPDFVILSENKNSKNNIQKIVTKFNKINNPTGFLGLLNELQEWEDKDKKHARKSITIKAIRYYLYHKKDAYRTFEIPKKSGGTRQITAPDRFLKKIQRLLNIYFLFIFQPYSCVHGFLPQRNVVTNAKKHVGKKYVYNIDIKDFFPSISFFRVWAVLQKVPPFQLDKEIARIIANLCCHQQCLPQGAPTSPILSNIVCMRLDRKFYQLSKKMRFTYTRYADDITISCNENIFTEDFKTQVATILQEEGFSLNPAKERLQRYNVIENGKLIRERQEVTGIIVNEKTNVSRTYIRNLTALLHNWENAVGRYGRQEGYNKTAKQYEYYYLREKGYTRYNGNIPPMEHYVNGKIEYLGMVRGKDDPTYRWMLLKFDWLCIQQDITSEQIVEILAIWDKDGIEKAMKVFYQRNTDKAIVYENDKQVFTEQYLYFRQAIVDLVTANDIDAFADIDLFELHPKQLLTMARGYFDGEGEEAITKLFMKPKVK